MVTHGFDLGLELGTSGAIGRFLRVFFVVVEFASDDFFGVALAPFGVAEAFVADGVAHELLLLVSARVLAQSDGLAFGCGVVKKRDEAGALHLGGSGEASTFGKGRVDVDELDEAVASSAALLLAGHRGDEETVGGLLVVGVLVPIAVIVEVPAVVTEEHDHGVVAKTLTVEFVEDLADVLVCIRGAGVVGADQFASLFARDGAVADVAVAAEFARVGAGEGRSAGGRLWVVGHLDFAERVKVEEALGGDEGEMRLSEADTEEERFAFEFFEGGDGLCSGAVVGEFVFV